MMTNVYFLKYPHTIHSQNKKQLFFTCFCLFQLINEILKLSNQNNNLSRTKYIYQLVYALYVKRNSNYTTRKCQNGNAVEKKYTIQLLENFEFYYCCALSVSVTLKQIDRNYVVDVVLVMLLLFFSLLTRL